MGFADLLSQLQIPYASAEAVEYAERIMKFIQLQGSLESERLANERGTFPNYEGSIYDGKRKMRNATITTIAPTGTISMICGASSGVEPIFAVAYTKNVLDGTAFVEVNPIFERYAQEYGFASPQLLAKIAETGSVQGLAEVPAWVQKIFLTAAEIAPEWHIRIQAAFQKYTDNAVSKTINFANSATREDVATAFQLAYELNCKGLTVYRDGSREEQVLSAGTAKGKKADDTAAGQVPPPNSITPRPRPEVTMGVTRKLKLAAAIYMSALMRMNRVLRDLYQHRPGGRLCLPIRGDSAVILSPYAPVFPSTPSYTDPDQRVFAVPPVFAVKGLVMSCPDAIARLLRMYMDVGSVTTRDKQ